LFTDYAGWWAVLSFGLSAILFFVAIVFITESEYFKTSLIISVLCLIFLGLGAQTTITWDKREDRQREQDYSARGCIEVSLEQLDVRYEGTPYILDEAYGRQRICQR
jgi:hypothetical protein